MKKKNDDTPLRRQLAEIDKSVWRDVSLQERRHHMANDMHIMYPDFVDTLVAIQDRMKRCIDEDKGAGMLCVMPSGGGKTHLCSLLKKLWPANHDGPVSHVPVVTFDVPGAATERSIAQALLRAIGDPKWAIGNALMLEDRAAKLIRATGTAIIGIDNCQDIPEKRREGGVQQVGTAIRRLIDNSKRLVLLFGTPAADKIIRSNSQLRRRMAARREIGHFSLASRPEAARFRRLLHELDKALPLAEMSELATPEMVRKMYWATNGIQSYLFEIAKGAVGAAVEAGRERLIIDDLRLGFDSCFQQAGENSNPFADGGPDRPLDHEGEPFENWFDASNPNPIQGLV